MFEDFDINNKFEGYKTTLLESKKYWIIYLGLILITCLSTVTSQNLAHPKFELMMFFIVAILGIFCIVYYFRHNNDKELYELYKSKEKIESQTKEIQQLKSKTISLVI